MRILAAIVVLIVVSCQNTPKKAVPLFENQEGVSGITFENILTYDEAFNPYVYRNFYNGGGVAIGDINNDGLEDVYLTGNMVDNKLFLNKGDWQFEDITSQAGVACAGVWSTGATFADINGDGLLDLYVCKSGKPEGANRHNELFINNGDLTFSERSKEYGLDVTGLSVHASFLDYDRDGDLDVYVLNNSIRSIGGFDLIKDQRKIPDSSGNGNKFFRNDGNRFVDITEEAGIYSSKIGFGLGITVGDFNNDHWPDIFISNDFFERDYLYINDTLGHFEERLEDYFGSISMGSMGADLADLDNDLQSDLMVTEMLPATDERKKTKAIYESWDKQKLAIDQGYFYQYPRNTLHRNIDFQKFLEMGRQAGVAATEWSWGALLFDMDNDGLRDIFVSNGIYKDLLDRDYLSYHANEESVRSRIRSKQKNVITELIDAMPSQPVPNAAYRNLGGFRFEDSATEWGLGEDSFSNGSAYGDLDNDGDLDLIVNNVNMPAFVYRNGADTLGSRSIRFELEQSGDNRKAIGSQVTISYGGKKAMAENYVSRGFQSSVSPILHFGVGSAKRVDTVQIRWPDGHIQKLGNLETNRKHHITHPNDPAISTSIKEGALATTPLREIAPLFDFEHRENPYIDFNNERLLTQMYSNEGPAFASADVNGDGRPDFYLGGAKNQSGSLYLSREGTYVPITEPFESDAVSEEVQALFFDGDGDGDDDLYICHGGRAFSPHSQALHDAYYRNDDGAFLKIPEALSLPAPISTGVAAPADYDGDGDLDLFVGERYKPHLYGTSGSGLILQNDGNGNFAALEIPALQNLGMVTDAAWTDIDGDGRPDLVVSGEWMSINIFANTEDGFEDQTERYGLDQTEGLWQSIEIADFDGDGDDDILAGNIGRNNFFEPGTRMYIADFDGNGFAEQITCLQRNGKYYPIIDKDELIAQIPSLKKKLLFYSDYAKSDMASLFDAATLEQAEILDLNLLESTVFLRAENGFQASPLPQEIQYAPVYDTTRYDINGDGFPDIFLGGNQYLVKPQFGRYDASMGWVIFGPLDPNTDAKVSPLSIEGQIRHMEWVESDKGAILVVSLNNGKTRFYE